MDAFADPLRDPEATLREATEGESDRVWATLRADPEIGETTYRGYAAVTAVLIHDRLAELSPSERNPAALRGLPLVDDVLLFPDIGKPSLPSLSRIPRGDGESEAHHRCVLTENMLCMLLCYSGWPATPPVPMPVRDPPRIRFPHFGIMERMMRCAATAERMIATPGFHAKTISVFGDYGFSNTPDMFNDLRGVAYALLKGMPENIASARIAAATGGWWSRSLEQAVNGLGGADVAGRMGLLGAFGYDYLGLQACGDCGDIGAVATRAIRLRTRWEGRPPSRTETVDALTADSLNARERSYDNLCMQPMSIPKGSASKPVRLEFLARKMTIRATVNQLLDEAWRGFYDTELSGRCKRIMGFDDFITTLHGARQAGVRPYGRWVWDWYAVSRTIPTRQVPDAVRDAVEGMLCDGWPPQFAAEAFAHEAGGRGVWQAAVWYGIQLQS